MTVFVLFAADFGLAKLYQPSEGGDNLKTLCGTPGYVVSDRQQQHYNNDSTKEEGARTECCLKQAKQDICTSILYTAARVFDLLSSWLCLTPAVISLISL